MKENKKKHEIVPINSKEMKELQTQYVKFLDTEPKYSLKVDPENKYNMSDMQKEFVTNYVQYKSINTAAEMTGIDNDTALDFFKSYNVQQEIRRINLALCQRQFSNKLLDIDEIGGYLSSLITGENVPWADQIKTSEKIQVAKMLIDLNQMKAKAFEFPEVVIEKDINTQIKELSVDTIKELLNKQEDNREKDKIILQISDANTPEENAYLHSLSTKQLLEMLETINKNKEENNEQGNTKEDGSK